jgi:uncharacterized protein
MEVTKWLKPSDSVSRYTVTARQSFNCQTADRPDEVLICQSAELSALDERMSSLYYHAAKSAVRF